MDGIDLGEEVSRTWYLVSCARGRRGAGVCLQSFAQGWQFGQTESGQIAGRAGPDQVQTGVKLMNSVASLRTCRSEMYRVPNFDKILELSPSTLALESVELKEEP